MIALRDPAGSPRKQSTDRALQRGGGIIKAGPNSSAGGTARYSHRGIKQKAVTRLSKANTLRRRKREANKGRSRLPWRLRGTSEGHCGFIGRNVLVPRPFSSCTLPLGCGFVFLFGTRHGRPVCCRKKPGLPPPPPPPPLRPAIPRSPCPRSPHLLRSRSPPRTTNEMSTVNLARQH